MRTRISCFGAYRAVMKRLVLDKIRGLHLGHFLHYNRIQLSRLWVSNPPIETNFRKHQSTSGSRAQTADINSRIQTNPHHERRPDRIQPLGPHRPVPDLRFRSASVRAKFRGLPAIRNRRNRARLDRKSCPELGGVRNQEP